MMDAYLGTIDANGDETLADALNLVESFFLGTLGLPLSDCSRLVQVGDDLASACLVGIWDERQRPLLYYVMTAARWKGQGLAGIALHHALQATAAAGYREILAFITDGNTPSEKLCARAGFR
jgi:GNAT superfamily N-acetyltransferase